MARLKLARAASFWLLATVFAFFLFAAGAPSPLYVVYEAMWHFSSLTLTAIFGVYALALLAALLTTGRLSDHLGRRPVVLLALLVPVAGLAAGALVSGLLVQYGPDPLHLVFSLLCAVYALAFTAMPVIADVAKRTPGWLQSMRPQIGVPPAARSLFAASAPSLIATWALGGLYLSLGPSLALSLLKSDSYLAGAGVIVALMGAVAVAATLVRAADARVIVIRASLVLVVGVGITELSVALGSAVGLYAGSVLAGLGFGPAFSAVFRSLAPLAPPDKRAGLLASIFIVVYLAFSVPALIAGVAVTHYGLRDSGDDPGRDDGGCGLAPQGPAPAAAVSARASIADRPLEAAMSRHLALVTSKREATLKPRAEGIAWMRVLIDRANGTPASRGNDPVAVVQR